MTSPIPIPARLQGIPHSWMASAPGRVNLIGEHVDYCGGLVLPAAIGLRTWMAGTPRTDRVLRIRNEEGEAVELATDAIPAAGPEKWANYLRGVLAGYLEAGCTIPGMDVEMASTLPQGGGLASSAAFTVAFATLLEQAAGRGMEPDLKARICQDAESRFAGVPSGCMDQLAAVYGRAGHAMLIDCRSRAVKWVPLRGVAILIINSGVRHDLADGAYAERRRETEEAAAILGVEALGDATMESVNAVAAELGPVRFRRARHVVSECGRVREFAAAVSSGDWNCAGRLMGGSHRSLRDDYEVSCAELDRIVEHAQSIPGIHGCRMTGGGFGGCCVALVDPLQAEGIAAAMESWCGSTPGPAERVWLTAPSDGAA